MEHDSYKENMTAARALALFNDVEFAEKYQEAGDEYTDMLLWCKDSLEKQIPKEPVETDWLYCPSCGKKLNVLEQKNYCANCGQKIDWSAVT